MVKTLPIKVRKSLKMPRIFFPNISNFKILLGPLSWIFALFGFSKRVNSSALYRNYRNGGVNRKLVYYFYMLHIFREQKLMGKFWKLAFVVLKDKDYMIGTFINVFPSWYKCMSLQEVFKILNEVERINSSPLENLYIDYKRVYILKADGKRFRPLGVPTKAWRVYLSMLNNLINFVRIDSLGVLEQHGYLPQKSILTA